MSVHAGDMRRVENQTKRVEMTMTRESAPTPTHPRAPELHAGEREGPGVRRNVRETTANRECLCVYNMNNATAFDRAIKRRMSGTQHGVADNISMGACSGLASVLLVERVWVARLNRGGGGE